MEEVVTQEMLEAEVDRMVADERSHALVAGPDEEDDEVFCDWYMAQIAQADALDAAIKKQQERRLAQVAARRNALVYVHGVRFRSIVERRIGDTKGRKSIDFPSGRAGLRRRPEKLEILDRNALTDWCIDNCPEALGVSFKHKTPIKKRFADTGELPPGMVHIPARDAFYPEVSLAQLDERAKALLEANTTPPEDPL